jgi:hypothetical protein
MPGKRECLAVETARRVRCGCGTCVRVPLPRPSRLYSTMRNPRRFPPPWSVKEAAACFICKTPPINAKIDGRGASESVCLFAVGPWSPAPVLVRHPTLPCAHQQAFTRHVWGTRQSRRLRTADGFAASPQMTTRRFPSPWSVEQLDACFVVRDHTGQELAYFLRTSRGGDQRPSCSARTRRGGSR